MRVNLEHTHIIVFVCGGYLNRQEQWFYHCKQVACVSYYKFLGLLYQGKQVPKHAVLCIYIVGTVIRGGVQGGGGEYGGEPPPLLD
jgi:hypothetical protein